MSNNLPAQFLHLLRPLIEKHFDETIDVFDIDRPRYETCLATGKSLTTLYGKSRGGEFGVGIGEVSAIADIISVISAAFAVVTWTRTTASRPLQATVVQRLTAELVAHGVPADKAADLATKIAADFKNDVLSALEA